MQIKWLLLILSSFPVLIIFAASTFSLFIALQISQQYIEQYLDNLFQDQIMFSKQFTQSISQQVSFEVQKIPHILSLLNHMYAKILSGQVKYNEKHKQPSLHMEMVYTQQEDPQLLNLFNKSSTLTSNWYHKNITNIKDLRQECQDLLRNASLINPLLHSLLYENTLTNQINNRKFQFKDIFFGFEIDGMLFTNSVNTTYSKLKPDPKCGNGIFNMDARCRYWYKDTLNSNSIMTYKPTLFYSDEGNPFLATVACQQMRQYSQITKQDGVYLVLCINLQFQKMAKYFMNYVKSTKQSYMIEPRSQAIVFDSQIPLGRSTVENFSSVELNSLQSKDQAQKFNDTLNNNFSNQIAFQSNETDLVKISQLHTQQQIFSYNRNGTQNQVILNPVYIIDKLPQFKGVSSYQQSGFQFKLLFLQINIISDEELREKTNELIQFFSKFYVAVIIFLIVFAIISVIITVYQSLNITKLIFTPITHLTSILQKIQIQEYSTNLSEIFSEYSLNTDEIFFSKETKQLYESFEIVFKMLQGGGSMELGFKKIYKSGGIAYCMPLKKKNFSIDPPPQYTSENFFKQNESQTLLNLHSQIQFFEQFKNLRALGICHNNIGSIFLQKNQFFEALEHFSQAIIYSQYEIQEFCNVHNCNSNSVHLSNYCYNDCHNNQQKDKAQQNLNFTNQNQQNQKKSSMNKQSRIQLLSRMSFFSKKSRNKSISCSNEIFQQFQAKSFNNELISQQELQNEGTSKANISNQASKKNKEDQQRINLLKFLFQRKKNYIITLLAFQESQESKVIQNKNINFQYCADLYKDIERLLKELLNISYQIPKRESQQIDIYCLISKCQFKQNKLSQSQCSLLKSEEILKQNQQNNQLKLIKRNKDETEVNFTENNALKQKQRIQFIQGNNIYQINKNLISLQSKTVDTNQKAAKRNSNTFQNNLAPQKDLLILQVISQSSNEQSSQNTPKSSLEQKSTQSYQQNSDQQRQKNNINKQIQFYSNTSQYLQEQNYKQEEEQNNSYISEQMTYDDIYDQNQKEKLFKKNKKKEIFSQDSYQQLMQNILSFSQINQDTSELVYNERNMEQNISSIDKLNISLNKSFTKKETLSPTRINGKRKSTQKLNNICDKVFNKIPNSGLIQQDIYRQSQEHLLNNTKNEEILQTISYSNDVLECIIRFCQAEYFIHTKNYLTAALIITNLIENSRVFMSNYPNRIYTTLKNLFDILGIFSEELSDTCYKVNQVISMQVVVIYEELEQQNNKLNSLSLTSGLMNKILTQKNDKLGLVLVDHTDGYIQPYMHLTKVQSIKNIMNQIIYDIQDGMTHKKDSKQNNKFKISLIKLNQPTDQLNNFEYQNQTDNKIVNHEEVKFNQNHQKSDQQQVEQIFLGIPQTISNIQVNNKYDKEFQNKRNMLFHHSIRKILTQFFLDQQQYYKQRQKQCFKQQDQLQDQCNFLQTNNNDLIEQNQKYVIYCTDQIFIQKNRLFDELCKILSALNITILILCKNKTNNFIELSQEQTYKYNNQNIFRIFYSDKNLLDFILTERNNYLKNFYATFIQHF